MGTRMLASVESRVHQGFKSAILDAQDDGTLLLSLAGNPTMRCCESAWPRNSPQGRQPPISWDK